MGRIVKRLSQTKVAHSKGFTIVELLIVVVIIGILAAIVIVAYNGISQRAVVSNDKVTLIQLASKSEVYKTLNSDTYAPSLSTLGVNGAGITYSVGGAGYCASMVAGNATYYVSNTQATPIQGVCPFISGSFIQTATSANCPGSMTLAVDARDNLTYWIQKMADGKCWMLTNLAYAGGGTNTYGDTKTVTQDPGAGLPTFTQPGYYIPSGANPTTNPTNPSTSTTGIGQYGYLYNWCAAMGGQATAACANAATPTPDTTISICPSGWRLPTSNSGEFTALNNAVNGGSSSTDVGLRSSWIAQYSGQWGSGFSNQDTKGFYWSSTHYPVSNANDLYFFNTNSSPNDASTKTYGFAMRCIAI